MAFFEDGTATGGRRYRKEEIDSTLPEIYAANAENKQRRDEILAELRILNRDIADLEGLISELEAYGR